jgi:hypothetical protein
VPDSVPRESPHPGFPGEFAVCSTPLGMLRKALYSNALRVPLDFAVAPLAATPCPQPSELPNSWVVQAAEAAPRM